MTLAEFNALDLDHRCEAIWEWGFYISRNKTDKINKVLYSLNGFFAEMVLHIEDNQVTEVNAFEKVDQSIQPGYFIKNDNPFIRK
ncbi:hypothetical protein [Aurantibacillus circumpalustris]|uniref:hypothetical protein n=1 Tax=Aurantibacillus circumpalustris TaxID=3036359 RepID=UPI00295B9877|nr:hypothetical protein [Aurantibacillus circumpalustris]